MSACFDLQGHRGARGLRPENTLPSFEAAFDVGVSAVETDLHLTRDGVVVLCHDPLLATPAGPCPVSLLTHEELRRFPVERPNPQGFLDGYARVTPLAERFAREHDFDPWAIPTLAELLAFAAAFSALRAFRHSFWISRSDQPSSSACWMDGVTRCRAVASSIGWMKSRSISS